METEAQRVAAMVCRTHWLLIRQRLQTVSVLRDPLAEHGAEAPSGISHLGRLAAIVGRGGGELPAPLVVLARVLLDRITALTTQIRPDRDASSVSGGFRRP